MAVGGRDYSQYVFTTSSEMEQEKASVTDAETTVTFSAEVKAWVLYNDGPYPVYFNDSTGVSTNNFKLPSGAWMMVDVPATTIYLICNTGETATVFALGLR